MGSPLLNRRQVKQEFTEAGALDAFKKLLGNNLFLSTLARSSGAIRPVWMRKGIIVRSQKSGQSQESVEGVRSQKSVEGQK